MSTKPCFHDRRMHQVDIIASGYEFTCPECETLNHLHEVPKDDGDGALCFCSICGAKCEIDTTNVEHARG
jgi:transcription elongation factor Elf1